MNLKDVLIVVDMQNDFINGSLGSEMAQSIVPKVVEKIKQYHKANKTVYFTMDTHSQVYLNTFEGRHLPIKHCIKGTSGYALNDDIGRELDISKDETISKETFGADWSRMSDFCPESIEICGLCTDICVISNALILRAMFPSTEILCDSSCCAGTTEEKHNSALEVMKSCQIEVI